MKRIMQRYTILFKSKPKNRLFLIISKPKNDDFLIKTKPKII